MKHHHFLSFSLLLTLTLGLSSRLLLPSQASDTCSFRQSRELRQSDRYGIFGDDEFDTVVCGYLVTRQEKVWDNTINVAYLRITQFQQPGFRQAIAQGIEQGNSINMMRDGQYEFNLGCFQDDRITGKQYEPQTPYLTTAVQDRLKNSSKTQPIALVLSFGKHRGSECECCNLAHYIRNY